MNRLIVASVYKQNLINISTRCSSQTVPEHLKRSKNKNIKVGQNISNAHYKFDKLFMGTFGIGILGMFWYYLRNFFTENEISNKFEDIYYAGFDSQKWNRWVRV